MTDLAQDLIELLVPYRVELLCLFWALSFNANIIAPCRSACVKTICDDQHQTDVVQLMLVALLITLLCFTLRVDYSSLLAVTVGFQVPQNVLRNEKSNPREFGKVLCGKVPFSTPVLKSTAFRTSAIFNTILNLRWSSS